jgi:Tfp pilus assembly protein PilO
MKSANRLIAATLAVTALAVAFWVLALGPKRQEASDLSGQVDQISAALAESRFQLTEAATARHEFPADYRQLVVLGKAVPSSDDTSSLLVELNLVARASKVTFNSIQLSSTAGGEAAAAPVPAPAAPVPPAEGSPGAVPAAASVPPTEAAASLLPLGATVGTAGLGVMPYNLDFSGDFFQVADFIKGIDSLVKTGGDVAVDGRLVTLDGFALVPNSEESGISNLKATFAVTTYVVPPTQGVTAGATPIAPAPETATPAATAPSGETTPSSSTPVSAAQ